MYGMDACTRKKHKNAVKVLAFCQVFFVNRIAENELRINNINAIKDFIAITLFS